MSLLTNIIITGLLSGFTYVCFSSHERQTRITERREYKRGLLDAAGVANKMYEMRGQGVDWYRAMSEVEVKLRQMAEEIEDTNG